jgi:hypothetical protein
MTAKEEIVAVVNEMPASSSVEEIAEKVQIHAKLRRSLGSVAAGRVKTHAEVKEIFRELSSKWKAK